MRQIHAQKDALHANIRYKWLIIHKCIHIKIIINKKSIMYR